MLSYINTGSVSQARKAEGIKSATWAKWQQDEVFDRVFKIVSNPVAFTYALQQLVQLKATLEHLKLLSHPSVKVRTWGIERAQKLQEMANKSQPQDPRFTFNISEVRHVLESPEIMATLPEADRKLLTKGPFEILEGEVISDGEPAPAGETVLRLTPSEKQPTELSK